MSRRVRQQEYGLAVWLPFLDLRCGFLFWTCSVASFSGPAVWPPFLYLRCGFLFWACRVSPFSGLAVWLLFNFRTCGLAHAAILELEALELQAMVSQER